MFSHGADSEGLAGPECWAPVLSRASTVGTFLGDDTRAFPRDFASKGRFNRELRRIRHRHRFPLPPPTPLEPALDALHRPADGVTVPAP